MSQIRDDKSVEENGKMDLRAEKGREGPGALSVSRSKIK